MEAIMDFFGTNSLDDPDYDFGDGEDYYWYEDEDSEETEEEQDFKTLYLKRLKYCKKNWHKPDLHSFVVTKSDIGRIQVEYDHGDEYWAAA